MVQVDQGAVEPVGQPGAAGAGAEGVIRAEHDVVGEQLGAAVEQFGEGLLTICGVEPVLRADRHPGQIAALGRDLLVPSRLLGLEPRKLLPGRLPFLAASYPVLGHGASSGRATPVRRPVTAKLTEGGRDGHARCRLGM
jgi:hypothetical protein